jgi:hypothetical protein
MNNNQDITKFEFLLSLGNNIVCQRYFNVKNYNPSSRNCMELYEYVKEICEDISHDLKIKTSDFLVENQHFFLSNDFVENETENEKEVFMMEIRLDEDVFIKRVFPANYYHPKIRYTVDIRPQLKQILSDLTKILSTKKVTTTYMGYDLNIKQEVM